MFNNLLNECWVDGNHQYHADFFRLRNSELQKLFSKAENKVYEIFKVLKSGKGIGKEFTSRPKVNVKAIFYLHPHHRGHNWLLDQVFYSIPCYEFNPYMDNLSRSYFRDTVSYNGNLRNRPDTEFNKRELLPMIMLDMDISIYTTVSEDLFGTDIEVHDLCFNRFEVSYSFDDPRKLNKYLRGKYGDEHDFYITIPYIKDIESANANIVLPSKSLALQSFVVDVLDFEDGSTIYPMSSWKNLKFFSMHMNLNILFTWLKVYDLPSRMKSDERRKIWQALENS